MAKINEMEDKRKIGRGKIIIGITLAVLTAGAVIFYFCFFLGSRGTVRVTRTAISMGTPFTITLYGRRGFRTETAARGQLSETVNVLFECVDRLDLSVLSWRSDGSEVSRFNSFQSTEPFPISPEFAEALGQSLVLSEFSGGVLDVTLRPLIAVWNIEDADSSEPWQPPADEELQSLVPLLGTEHLTLTDSALRKDDPGISLDMGAVGKGYALDMLLPVLRENQDITGAVIAAGGSILTYGEKPDPWQIGIRDPEGSPADFFGILTVPAEPSRITFISTSGGYEKYAEADGVIYEHILDGRTLRPAESGLYSVTVITGESGLASDGLSTACYILGMNASRKVLSRYEAEAVFVTREREVYLTSGLRECLELTNPLYTLAGEVQ